MSTRTEVPEPAGALGVSARRLHGCEVPDPADAVARIAVNRRKLLLGAYRDQLRREDLEDCYSQATLELLARARSGPRLDGATHIAHALEQKFASRVQDRRRALAGRSAIEAALGRGVSLDSPEGEAVDAVDPAAGTHERVACRIDIGRLREVAQELTEDQRLVLSSQVGLGMGAPEFCRLHDWSPTKFRKVAQRARERLTVLVREYGTGERCRRLEPDLAAHVARVASDEASARIMRHLENCTACRARIRDLRMAERAVVAIAVGPAGAGGALAGGVAAGAGAAGVGAAGVGAASSGSFLFGGAGALKVGMVALCLAGLGGGGVLVCTDHAPRRVARPRPARATHVLRRAPRAADATIRGRVSSAQPSRRSPTAAPPSATGQSRAQGPAPVAHEFRSPLEPPAPAPRRRPVGASAARAEPPRPAREPGGGGARPLALGFEHR